MDIIFVLVCEWINLANLIFSSRPPCRHFSRGSRRSTYQHDFIYIHLLSFPSFYLFLKAERETLWPRQRISRALVLLEVIYSYSYFSVFSVFPELEIWKQIGNRKELSHQATFYVVLILVEGMTTDC